VTSPLLSVTVSNRNYARFLDRNIESILSQTFGDYEIILIDNASDDGSLDVLRHYEAADRRIRVVAHARDLGLFASLRESCDIARGRYRVHVDADDWILDPNAFETQLDVLESHPGMAFVYSAMTMTDSGGKVVHVSHPHNCDVVLPGEVAVESATTTWS
jgi:glycosyltransferase involved in cell wall biosynthesis